MITQIIALIIYCIARLFYVSYRYRFVNADSLEEIKSKSPGRSYIYAVWHQNILGSILSQIGNSHVVIVSASKDGELVAVTLEKLGNLTARGSSRKGGKKAMLEMIHKMQDGTPAAISVDGPKGPPREVKFGIIELAKITGLPIIPLIVYPEKFWSFKKSWDQFRVPKPFTRIIVRVADPIYVDKETPRDNFPQICQQLKSSLTSKVNTPIVPVIELVSRAAVVGSIINI